VANCRGRYVALLVQDAVPDSTQWLERLVAPLDADPRLAGTYARQIPRADASPITRHYLSGWVAASATPRVSFVEGRDAFERLSPMERYLACVFDNVSSCVRKDVWERFPFKPTRIAEDVEWALDVLLAGHGLAYVPEAAVVHSHDRPARYELARTYLVHQRLRRLFGLATVPTVPSLARAIISTMPLHLTLALNGAGEQRSARAIARALALGVAFPLGQYLGIRSADTGWELLQPRGV
jgi:rhamnosyltransferase